MFSRKRDAALVQRGIEEGRRLEREDRYQQGVVVLLHREKNAYGYRFVVQNDDDIAHIGLEVGCCVRFRIEPAYPRND